MGRFNLTYIETLRMTQHEFHMYLLAHQIKMQEAELLSAKQAWFNQLVKATKKVGRETRSAYKSFDDFYNNANVYRNIFESQENKEKVRKLNMADMNRRLNSKGG